jgi:hypothetical protein
MVREKSCLQGVQYLPRIRGKYSRPQRVNSGSFYIGLDLENYAGSSKENIFAGYNSNTDDIYCVMNFAAQGAAITTRFDAFALFDTVVVFDNNTAYIKF